MDTHHHTSKMIYESIKDWAADSKRPISKEILSGFRKPPRQHSACGTKGCKYCDR